MVARSSLVPSLFRLDRLVVVLRLWFVHVVACDLFRVQYVRVVLVRWPLGAAEDRALAQTAAQPIQVGGNLRIVRSAASNSEVLHQLQRPRCPPAVNICGALYSIRTSLRDNRCLVYSENNLWICLHSDCKDV